jgi:hypothetical protein
MRRSSWAVVVIVVMVACAFAYHRLSAPLPPDEQQIRDLLVAGESAIERRDAKAAFSCVSKDYSDPSGFNRDALRLQVIEAFRSSDGFDVSVQTDSVEISGDKAEVRTDVMLAAFQGRERHEIFSGPVTIRLQREPARRLLALPTGVWRVAGMSGLPMSPEGL